MWSGVSVTTQTLGDVIGAFRHTGQDQDQDQPRNYTWGIYLGRDAWGIYLGNLPGKGCLGDLPGKSTWEGMSGGSSAALRYPGVPYCHHHGFGSGGVWAGSEPHLVESPSAVPHWGARCGITDFRFIGQCFDSSPGLAPPNRGQVTAVSTDLAWVHSLIATTPTPGIHLCRNQE